MRRKELDHQITLGHNVFGSTRLGSYGGEASTATHSLGKPLKIPIRQIHHAETPSKPFDRHFACSRINTDAHRRPFHQWHKPIVSRAT